MRFLFAVLSVALLAASANADVNGRNAKNEFMERELFEKFKSDHNKQYETSELNEYRYGIFVDNLGRIDQLNAANGEPAFGINKFADLTPREFRDQYLGYRPPQGQGALDRLKVPVTHTPSYFANITHVDWREKNAVTKVKDQGSCGSCWAFSAVETVESAWFLAGNTLPTLSEQQVVDCDTVDWGCDGGDTPTAYEYIMDAGGLEAETSYPYKAVDGKCAFSASKVVATISNYTYAVPPCYDSCKSQNEALLLTNLNSVGPASICVNADLNWQLYTSGIIKSGSGAYSSLNHCVQLVGYNEDGSNKYWIVRNSWGTSWGNAGYIYLLYGSNISGVASEATFVTI